MKMARAQKKPVPRHFAGWRREVEGIVKFLSREPQLVDENGLKWWNKMATYYRERYAILLAAEPEMPKHYKPPKLPVVKSAKADPSRDRYIGA